MQGQQNIQKKKKHQNRFGSSHINSDFENIFLPVAPLYYTCLTL